MEKLIKLAIADNYKIFRDGISIAMRNRDNIDILWEASNSEDMLNSLHTQIPDVLLMDLELPGADVIKNIQFVKKEYEDLKLIVTSMFDDMETITQVMENGANAYLGKTADADEIYRAINTCAVDDFYFNELVNEAVLVKLQQNKHIKKLHPTTAKFNDKELRILLINQ